MKNFCSCHVIGVLGSSQTYAEEYLPSVSHSSYEPVDSTKGAKDSSFNWMKKLRKRSNDLSQREVELSTGTVSDTMKRKRSLSKRLFQGHIIERYFRKQFTVRKTERLREAYQCSLFTTAGPIKGRLFITSERIAFHSSKTLKVSSSQGEIAKVPYKVSIPVGKVKKTTQSENLNKPQEKYVEILTTDDFEFWFMDFKNYQRLCESLHLAKSEKH